MFSFLDQAHSLKTIAVWLQTMQPHWWLKIAKRMQCWREAGHLGRWGVGSEDQREQLPNLSISSAHTPGRFQNPLVQGRPRGLGAWVRQADTREKVLSEDLDAPGQIL